MSLAAVRASRAVLDGGWWPRSRDPVAELPGLILALNERYGPIRQLMLNSGTWDGHFRRLAVGTRVVRVGWFSTVDPGMLIATTERGDQIDLLVVPPEATAATADTAMATAADPTNRLRAAAILAASRTAPAAERSEGVDPSTVWDNEGGHSAREPSRRHVPAEPANTL
ncbi:DUF5994 family protein [Dactylosporangium fulvum]|uniref:DUF5994 family protein n=2 Tax=Dactylosporangium fulvum TaxID=53359 RepID=A0ABY5WBJ3_9ACTN|nr:DUF5994 family protein [Dactylosporangium fulvum]UWP85451.1 DUF5994 family protein [Dactylosporangium fulvum]